MIYIPIIVGSTRRGRQSPKVALFLAERLRRTGQAETEILDLAEYNFPMMEERLRMQETPPPGLVEFSAKLQRADAILVVSPEYNNGYPGVLKNALDYFGPAEYKNKPFGIATVSAGGFGGQMCLSQLRLIALGLGGFPIPAAFPVSVVQNSFDDEGNPAEARYEKSATAFLGSLVWYAEAVAAQKSKEQGGTK
jgi:NAD(P)H-dependent FMN reductase